MMVEISFEEYRKRLPPKNHTRQPREISEFEKEISKWIHGLEEILILPTRSRKGVKYSTTGLKTVKKFPRLFARMIYQWEFSKQQVEEDPADYEFTLHELEELD